MFGNQLKTAILLGLMTVFVIWIGGLIGGKGGMIMAFIFAGAMNFVSYWYSDKIVLKMYNAYEVTAHEAPDLYGIVEELAYNAGLPMPKVYIIPEKSPNAFATGRNPGNAVVAVTQGLLNLMSYDEIKGVLAHEMAHIKNRDILIGSIAATMAGAIMMLANMAKWSLFFGGMGSDDDEGGPGIIGIILASVLAPIAAILVQMGISRSREYLADETGAKIAKTPYGLANALEKLEAYSGRMPMNANPATAHMFIVNPLSGSALMSLFSTHPPIEERIARLRGYADGRNTRDKEGPSPADNIWDRLR